MEIKSFYVTVDGKQFTNKEEAKYHELTIDTLDSLRDLLSASINSYFVKQGNCDNVLKHILLESDEVLNILKKFRKSKPTAKPAQQGISDN